MITDSIIFRFAPSPTGYLHLGGVRTAALNWLAARQTGGKFFLRIEDTDQARSTQEFEDDLLDQMKWLGMSYDDGPPSPHFRQSENGDWHDEAARKLVAEGRAYGCDCTPERLDGLKKRQASLGLPPRYDGHCRKRGLPPEAPNVIRFWVDNKDEAVWEDLFKGTQKFTAKAMGDFVIRTSEGRTLFDLAGLVDDYHGGITHVLRGEDHLANTARHRLIQGILGYDPPTYGHLPLLKDNQGQKLSKRHLDAMGIKPLREQGYLPQALMLYALDLGEGLMDPEVLAKAFGPEGELLPQNLPDWKRLSRTGGRVDLLHIDHFQREVLRNLPEAGLKKAAVNAGLPEFLQNWPGERLREFWLSAPKPKDFVEVLRHLEQGGAGPADEKVAAALRQIGEAPENFKDHETFMGAIKDLCKSLGLKPKEIFHPLRLVLSGVEGGPPLWMLVEAIGVETAQKRLSSL